MNHLLITQPSYHLIRGLAYQQLIVDKIWNLTNEVHQSESMIRCRAYPYQPLLESRKEMGSRNTSASAQEHFGILRMEIYI